jgi:hypothetical protein
MAPALFACPGCACHVRSSEARCPLCGVELPPVGLGPLPRTAAAVAMGLAVLATAPACGEATAEYGVGPTSGGGSVGDGGAGGAGGSGGADASGGGDATTTTAATTGGQGGAGGEDVTAEYGIGPTGGGGSGG